MMAETIFARHHAANRLHHASRQTTPPTQHIGLSIVFYSWPDCLELSLWLFHDLTYDTCTFMQL